MNFFTSDLHFYHKNIIKYSDLPYKDTKEMVAKRIKNIQSVCARYQNEKRNLYFLGDYQLSKSIELFDNTYFQIAPYFEKIYWIKGNHDNYYLYKKVTEEYGVIGLKNEYEIEIGDFKVKLLHNPADATQINNYYLHGHIHNNSYLYNDEKFQTTNNRYFYDKEKNNLFINLSIDVWNEFIVPDMIIENYIATIEKERKENEY